MTQRECASRSHRQRMPIAYIDYRLSRTLDTFTHLPSRSRLPGVKNTIPPQFRKSVAPRDYNPVAETIAPQQAGPQNNLAEIRIGVELSVSDNHAFPKGRPSPDTWIPASIARGDTRTKFRLKVGEACNGSARARIVSLSIRTLARDGVRSQPGSSPPIEFLRNFVTGI